MSDRWTEEGLLWYVDMDEFVITVFVRSIVARADYFLASDWAIDTGVNGFIIFKLQSGVCLCQDSLQVV